MEQQMTRLEEAGQPAGRRPFFLRWRFLLAGLVLAGALGYLIYAGVQSASMYYLTVGELLDRGDSVRNETVRLGGTVLEDSVQTDSSTMLVSFTVSDGQRSIPVRYKGVLPDAFKPGADVVVEGQLDGQGVFEASTLLAKCPSKYEPKT